jgi:hypothetical protein
MPERAPAGAGFVYLPVFGPGYGRWRLEMETAEPVKLDYFLNVLEPALIALHRYRR